MVSPVFAPRPLLRLIAAGLIFAASGLIGYAQTVTKAPGATMTTAPKSATTPAKRSPPAPDPGLFDGSGYPPEERPERGLLADFEAGAHEPSAGGSEEEEGPGGGGQEEQALAQIDPVAAALAQMTQAGGGQDGPEQSGGAGGQAGEQGQSATPIAAAADQEPVKPGEVALGDPNSRIAQAPEGRKPPPGAQTSNERGEDRMSVKSAAGAQSTPNRSRGGERGIDIPSNL